MKRLLIVLFFLLGVTIVYSDTDIGIDSIGFNIGIVNLAYEKEDTKGNVTLAKELDESYSQIEIYGLVKGIYADNTIKPIISYGYAKNNDFHNHMLAIGVNKYYEMNSYRLYAGLMGGYGLLDWKYNPVSNAKDIDSKTSSFIGVVQAGAEYEVEAGVFVTLNVKYILSNYESHIEPSNLASTTIDHKNGNSVSVGIRYMF